MAKRLLAQRFADGGDADQSPMPKRHQFQIMQKEFNPTLQKQDFGVTVPNEVSIKSLTDAFTKAINYHRSLPYADRVINSKRAAQALIPHIGKVKSGAPVPLLGKNQKLLKTEKGYKGGDPVTLSNGQGIETSGLALAPAYKEGKFTTCPNSASCEKECLGKTSGNYFVLGGGSDLSEFKGPRLNSLRKTMAMLRNPEAFAVRLHDEIMSARQEAENNGNHLGVRLNVLSDINPRVHEAIIKAFPDVSFYDYTKNNTNPIAPNHHYTYSSTGISDPQNGVHNQHSNWKQMRKRLDTGYNVAMAFSDKEHLPQYVHDEESGRRYQVINGDTHDFRPMDIQPEGQNGVIVGLKNKNVTRKTSTAAKDSNGFFVNYDPKLQKDDKGKLMRQPSDRVNEQGKAVLGPTIPTNFGVTIPTQSKPPQLLTNDSEEETANG
jgi:hypothetical protein